MFPYSSQAKPLLAFVCGMDIVIVYSLLLFLLKVTSNLSKNVKLVVAFQNVNGILHTRFKFMKFNTNGANTVRLFRISQSCSLKGF